MAKWYAGAEQAAFKPMSGRYLAQLPTRNFWGGRQNYLVNEAEKAEIAEVLRDQRGVMVYTAIFCGIFCALAGAAHGLAAATHFRPIQTALGLGVLFVLVVIVMAVVPTAYARRRLAPLLATLQPTDLRISFQEQVESVARNVSIKVLVLGIVSGVLVIAGNVMMVADALYEGRPLGALVVTSPFGILFGGMLTAYFVWLIVLRNRTDGNVA